MSHTHPTEISRSAEMQDTDLSPSVNGNDAATRLKLYANGYPRIPILGKLPFQKQALGKHAWDITQERIEYYPAGTGTGLRTGAGIVALDIDVEDPSLAFEVREVATRYLSACGIRRPPVRIGRKGCVLLYACSDKEMRKLKTDTKPYPGAEGEWPAVEILASGQQFVAYGTHPVTQQPYTWEDGRGPLEVPVTDLPVATGWQLHELARMIAALFRRQGYGHARATGRGIAANDVGNGQTGHGLACTEEQLRLIFYSSAGLARGPVAVCCGFGAGDWADPPFLWCQPGTT